MALLEVRDLDVHYGGIHALKGVSFSVDEGKIVTLIGANGAGKTTTLRAISGLLKPTRGSVTFCGRPIGGLAAHTIVGRGLAHVPEGRGIFANLTVDENLSLGSYLRTDPAAVAKDRERALELFPRIRERLHQNAGTLSGGEQQMLAIARALLTRPKLLLLDEPSLGLAPLMVQAIFATLAALKRDGVTMLLVEQNMTLALQLADRAYVLRTGEIRLSGSAAALQADQERVAEAYLGAA